MITRPSYPSRFFGPLTDEQFKSADEGSLPARVIRKAELGVRGATLNLALIAAASFAATCWVHDPGLTRQLVEYEEALSAVGTSYVVLIGPFFEELACRGILQPILIGSAHRLMGGEEESRKQAVVMGVIGQAILFGGVHDIFPQKIATTGSGLLFGYLKEQTKHEEKIESDWWVVAQMLKGVYFLEGLVTPLAAHATNNGVVWLVGNAVTKI